MITVLSVPNSGTRFILYLISEIMGMEAQYVHFLPRFEADLQSLSGVVVMPTRQGRPVPSEYLKFIPDDVIHIDIAKTALRWPQVDSLVERTGAEWTNKLRRYVDLWEPVGSRHTATDPRSDQMIKEFRHD